MVIGGLDAISGGIVVSYDIQYISYDTILYAKKSIYILSTILLGYVSCDTVSISCDMR